MQHEKRWALEVVAVQLALSRSALRTSPDEIQGVLDVLKSCGIVPNRVNPFLLTSIGASDLAATWRMNRTASCWSIEITFGCPAIQELTFRKPEGWFRTHVGSLVCALARPLFPSRVRLSLRHAHLLRAGHELQQFNGILHKALLDRSVDIWNSADGIAGVPLEEFALDKETRVACRHGFTLASGAGALAYLLDTEISREDVSLADSARLLDVIDAMHRDHRSVLRTSLTEDALHVIDWKALPELA